MVDGYKIFEEIGPDPEVVRFTRDVLLGAHIKVILSDGRKFGGNAILEHMALRTRIGYEAHDVLQAVYRMTDRARRS